MRETAPKFDFSKEGEMERFKELPKEVQEQVIEAAHEEALGMILAKALELEYERGGPQDLSGVKTRPLFGTSRVGKNAYGAKTVDGYRVLKGNYGSYAVMVPSQFKLWVELPGSGRKVDVWAARDFREHMDIKLLTEKVRNAIADTKPSHVALVERQSERGTKYYRIDPDQLKEWAKNAKEALTKGKKMRAGAKSNQGKGEIIESNKFYNDVFDSALRERVQKVVAKAAKTLTSESKKGE